MRKATAARCRHPFAPVLRRLLALLMLVAAGGATTIQATSVLPAEPASGSPVVVTNPLLRPPAQDPQITYHDGRYYYCESSSKGIFLRAATGLAELAVAPRRNVWTPPASGAVSRNVWAPELHILDGRAYIYFAADDGDNANHRMGVLVAETDNLFGPYRFAGLLDTGGWAIDGTVLTLDNGKRYFIWSGWPGKRDGQQNLYIGPMKSPVELAGGRVLIKQPDQPWERRAMPICEGPQVLRRNGRTFLIYSASGSWTADYTLGMLVHEGGDPMNASTWKPAGQVFARNEFAYGVGHCGFVTSPDGVEDWLVYHAKTIVRDGWEDREVRAQPFTWDARGHPVFGEPVDPTRTLVHPSRMNGLFASKPAPMVRERSKQAVN